MISHVIQRKSGMCAMFEFNAEGKVLGTAELKNNVTFGGSYRIVSCGRECTLSYDVKERLLGFGKNKADKKRVPYKILDVFGDSCGAIYEKRTDGFFFNRYNYYDVDLDGKTYTMYIVGLGNEGTKYPVYLGKKQVALIEKEVIIHDNLDHYTVYTIDDSFNFLAYLICLYVDARFYGNRGEVSPNKMEKSVTITYNKKVKRKYNEAFKRLCD